jgi:hypothetical protein
MAGGEMLSISPLQTAEEVSGHSEILLRKSIGPMPEFAVRRTE